MSNSISVTDKRRYTQEVFWEATHLAREDTLRAMSKDPLFQRPAKFFLMDDDFTSQLELWVDEEGPRERNIISGIIPVYQ